MTRDAAAAVDAEADRAFPGLRDNFQATLVHAEVEEASPDLDKLRAEIVMLVREIGQLQTGGAVDMRWIKQAAAVFHEAASGETGLDFTKETDPRALKLAAESCKAQLKSDKEAVRPANPF